MKQNGPKAISEDRQRIIASAGNGNGPPLGLIIIALAISYAVCTIQYTVHVHSVSVYALAALLVPPRLVLNPKQTSTIDLRQINKIAN